EEKGGHEGGAARARGAGAREAAGAGLVCRCLIPVPGRAATAGPPIPGDDKAVRFLPQSRDADRAGAFRSETSLQAARSLDDVEARSGRPRVDGENSKCSESYEPLVASADSLQPGDEGPGVAGAEQQDAGVKCPARFRTGGCRHRRVSAFWVWKLTRLACRRYPLLPLRPFFFFVTQRVADSVRSLADHCVQTLDRLLSSLLTEFTESPSAPAAAPAVSGQPRSSGDQAALSTTGGSAAHCASVLASDDAGEARQLVSSIYAKADRLAEGKLRQSQTGNPERLLPLPGAPVEKYLVAIQEHLDACAMAEPADKYTLASALAALVNGLYQILDGARASAQVAEKGAHTANAQRRRSSAERISKISETSGRGVTWSLQKQMADLQGKKGRSEGDVVTELEDARIQPLWLEVERLMQLVVRIFRESDIADKGTPPSRAREPSSSSAAVGSGVQRTGDSASLPDYGEVYQEGHRHLAGDREAAVCRDASPHRKNEHDEKLAFLRHLEADRVLCAIDRLQEVTPRLNDQRVVLSDRQERALAAATLSKAVIRLSQGKLEEQRAEMSASGRRKSDLDSIFDRITLSAKRGLDDQRVCLSANQERNMELARLTGSLDKAAKSRMDNQEWLNPTQRRISDMTLLSKQLQDTYKPSMEIDQRFAMSATKERDMFVANLVGKMAGRRFGGQDADSPASRRARSFHKLEITLDRMWPGMDEQKFERREHAPCPTSAPPYMEGRETKPLAVTAATVPAGTAAKC
ncbi:MAG: hypothetical protein BJ554DRAFT_3194, partial [Olpidium bornovanus]